MTETATKSEFVTISPDDRDNFSRIVKLLVEFDERTGRYLKYKDPETHFMRKTVAIAAPEFVRFHVRHIGGFVYAVVASVDSPGGRVATAWVHEDGIKQERGQHVTEPEHPVHSIECVSDLFDRAVALDTDYVAEGLARDVRELMADRSGG